MIIIYKPLDGRSILLYACYFKPILLFKAKNSESNSNLCFKLSNLSHPTQFHFSPSNPFPSICNNLCSANFILLVTIYLTFIFYMQCQKN